MAKLFKIRWLIDLLLAACLVTALAGLIFNPRETSSAAVAGISLCLNVIIPSLFPFFVISTLTIELGLTRYLGALLRPIMRPLFRLSGSCSTAVILGFLGGYPVGAQTAIALYERKQCTKDEAERLLAFCNNSGPAFILGAVGAGILGSSQAGWLLYLTHTAASLTIGIMFRFYKRRSKNPCPDSATVGRDAPGAPSKDTRIPPETKRSPSKGAVALPQKAEPPPKQKVIRLSDAFSRSVKSSFQSVFFISAFVIFFTVAIHILFVTGVLPGAASKIGGLLGIQPRTAEQWLTGFIEISSGLWSLQGSATSLLAGEMAMAAFMLGWAGLSVHCQVLSFIGESGLSTRTYIIGKLLHGLISAGYTAFVIQVLGYKIPVSSVLAEQVEGIASMNFVSTLDITLKVGVCVFMVFLLSAALMFFRRGFHKSRL
ncbi:MAG: sporulation protein [Oscillospiraceae bacterium]|nr:sporulation protein [Oscillospiraceae bacterium]